MRITRERIVEFVTPILLIGILYPLAVAQGYLVHNLYVLPALFILAALLYVHLLCTSTPSLRLISWFYATLGTKRPVTAIAIVAIGGGLVGAGASVLGWKLFLAHRDHIAELIRKDLPQPVAQTALPAAPPQEVAKTQGAASGVANARGTVSPEPRPNVSEANPDGLKFREVAPEKLGLKPSVPDAFTIEAGTNRSTFPTVLLQQNVPFERLLMIKFGGDLPFRVWFNKNGEMRIDATVYERKGRVGAVIKNNDFAVLNRAWDRNWDDNALEIVDEHQNPVFQISRPQWNVIRLRGLFITSEGEAVVITDEGLMLNPSNPVRPPARLFGYPSAKHLHERVTP